MRGGGERERERRERVETEIEKEREREREKRERASERERRGGGGNKVLLERERCQRDHQSPISESTINRPGRGIEPTWAGSVRGTDATQDQTDLPSVGTP